jgi:DNA topoisomerase-3
VVEGLFRAGLIEIEQDSFDKKGKVIEFQRLSITKEGYRAYRERDLDKAGVEITEVQKRAPRKTKQKKRAASSGTEKKERKAQARLEKTSSDKTPAPELVAALKAWRLGLARQKRIPAFRILTDRTLNNIAAHRPKTEDDLLQISGVGETILKKHGKKILAICREMA